MELLLLYFLHRLPLKFSSVHEPFPFRHSVGLHQNLGLKLTEIRDLLTTDRAEHESGKHKKKGPMVSKVIVLGTQNVL